MEDEEKGQMRRGMKEGGVSEEGLVLRSDT